MTENLCGAVPVAASLGRTARGTVTSRAAPGKVAGIRVSAAAGDDVKHSERARGGALRNRRETVTDALAMLAPRLPEFEAEAVTDRALASAGLRGAAPETAAWLSLTAYARHVFTEYDALLADGYDRDSARHFVLDDLNAVLAKWGSRRFVSDEAEDEIGG